MKVYEGVKLIKLTNGFIEVMEETQTKRVRLYNEHKTSLGCFLFPIDMDNNDIINISKGELDFYMERKDINI